MNTNLYRLNENVERKQLEFLSFEMEIFFFGFYVCVCSLKRNYAVLKWKWFFFRVKTQIFCRSQNVHIYLMISKRIVEVWHGRTSWPFPIAISNHFSLSIMYAELYEKRNVKTFHNAVPLFTEVSDHHLLCLPVALYKSYFTFKIIFQWIICIEFRSLKIEPHIHSYPFYIIQLYKKYIQAKFVYFFSSSSLPNNRFWMVFVHSKCFTYTQCVSHTLHF